MGEAESLLDDHVVSWADPEATALRDAFVNAYGSLHEIKDLLDTTPVDWRDITLSDLPARTMWTNVLNRAADVSGIRVLVDAVLKDPVKANHRATFERFLEPRHRSEMADGPPLRAAVTVLAAAERSREPIIVGLQVDEPLVEFGLSSTASHITVKLTPELVESLESSGRDALTRSTSLDELVATGQRIWTQLTAAEPRLRALHQRLRGAGATQPIAWCGPTKLLDRLGAALQVAHTGGAGARGFLSVETCGSYLMPLRRVSHDRARAPRGPRTVQRRVDTGEVSVARLDLRECEDDRRACLAGIRTDVVLVVQAPDLGVLADLAEIVRADGTNVLRGVLAFGGETNIEVIDELLTVVPFVSCADLALADTAMLDGLTDVLRQHGEEIAMPCVVAAVRAARVAAAFGRGDIAGCLAGLSWSIWSWVGLPLFTQGYGDLERPLYPHLIDLRTVATQDWYVDRHARIAEDYQASALAAGPDGSHDRFHLYLSGAGGTGKSCFLRHVCDEIERTDRIAVWYRVDAPSSSWDSVEERLREETIKSIAARFDAETVQEVSEIQGRLGTFLRGVVKTIRGSMPDFEITVCIDQLERTFESGDAPNPRRLNEISRKVLDLLSEVRKGDGVRIFIASRKQYLPDFLVDSRAATDRGLEFIVLQDMSDSDERTQFVEKVVAWCGEKQLMGDDVSLRGDAVKEMVDNVDHNPLNMMLALIQLLSQSKAVVTKEDVARLKPWNELFRMDLADAESDELDLFFLLAMAHARTEIVRFEDVMWRLRMVSPRLTRRVDDLRDDGVRERLWMLGILGRTIYARPHHGSPMRFVEFFHANLRDYLLREVMGQGWSTDASRPRGTPPAWRALDRLAVFAHDWEQTVQPLIAEEIRVLMEHRDHVVAENLVPEERTGRFGLLFLRDPDDARESLSEAATACFAYSALVHDNGGRWAVETLYPDVENRLEVCRDWLKRSPGELKPPILRYLVSWDDPAARNLLVELLLDPDDPGADELAPTAAMVLREPLYTRSGTARRGTRAPTASSLSFRTGWRNDVLLAVLQGALQRSDGDPKRLPESVKAFFATACASDRTILIGEIGRCADRMSASEDKNLQAWGDALQSFDGPDDWIDDADVATPIAESAQTSGSSAGGIPIALVLGRMLRPEVTQAVVVAWSATLVQRVGLPVPEVLLVEGEVADDEAELRIFGQRIARGVFRPDGRRVSIRRWEKLRARSEQISGLRAAALAECVEGEEDFMWLPPAALDAAGVRLPALDYQDALVGWLERGCRRAFDQLFDLDQELAFLRQAGRQLGRNRLRSLDRDLLRRVLVELVEDGVPITSSQTLLETLRSLVVTRGWTQEELAERPNRRSGIVDKALEEVRASLATDITRSVAGGSGQIRAIVLDRTLEEALADRIENGPPLRTAEVMRLDAAIYRLVIAVRQVADEPVPLALVTVPQARRTLARLLHKLDRDLPVLAFRELEPELDTPLAGLVPDVLDKAAGTSP